MSYDFATNQICAHQVFFEQVALDEATRRVVNFIRPPANISSVEVYVDRVKIPRTGLYSFASLPFSQPEPYRITVGQNDLIYFGIRNGAPQFVQLVPGPNVPAKDIARELQRQFRDLHISVRNKRVFIRTRQSFNGKAFQFYDPRWTDTTSSLPTTSRVLNAYETIGIVPGRAAFGRKLFPGWNIEKAFNSPIDEDRQIKFESQIQQNDPLIEVNYTTDARNCRRCHGAGVEFDYRILNNTYEEIRNTDLLAQEWDKFLITKIGSHWKWTWLGSGLIDRIGGKAQTGGLSATSMITIDVNQSFRVYQSIKEQQEVNFPQSQVTDAEYPLQLTDLTANTLPDDPTVAIVTATIVSRSQVPVETIRVVGTPSPFALRNDPVSRLRLSSGFRFRG